MTVVKAVRLSPQEAAKIEALAAEAGLTVSGYFRATVLQAKPPIRSRKPPIGQKQLAQLLAQIGHIGGNLNQIAKSLNILRNQVQPGETVAMRETVAYTESVLEDVREASLAVQKALNHGD